NQSHSGRSRYCSPRSSRVAWRQGPQGSKQHLALAASATRTRTQRPRKYLAIHAAELVVEPNFQILRRHCRSLLLRLEHAHRSAVENHVHRPPRLGSRRSLNLRIGIRGIRRDLAASLKNQCRASVRRLFCAVGAIASISQAWDNEPSLIETIVDGRSPKTNIGMKPTHPLHSLLSGNQTDETDVLCSAFLDTINGGSGCIAGRQHRRHDDHEPLRKVGRSLKKIFDCNEWIGIAVKPDMRDTCGRHEIEHAFHECHAGPKNWRKNKFLSSDTRR